MKLCFPLDDRKLRSENIQEYLKIWGMESGVGKVNIGFEVYMLNGFGASKSGAVGKALNADVFCVPDGSYEW